MSTVRVWEARTGSGLHPDLLAYSETIHEDTPFLVHDLCGSTAHVAGLVRAGLLNKDDASRIILVLRQILRDHNAGAFALDVELEDLHMNIESRLTSDLGDVGRRLHTGRSRNDQVATCIVLYAREGLAALAEGLGELGEVLTSQAEAHLETPWVARTHGLPAQPATLGFLLAAHAHRIQDAQQRILWAFDQSGESPLGSGAIGGSTLPLDPAYTARLMGLRPPRSALLATGTRDVVLAACRAAHEAGLVLASLCEDLLALFVSGAIRLPDGYTTGSSLMPQKRNPDALELARGRAKALAAPYAAVSSILSGLGLGYQRDFQLTKPYLVAALTDARRTVRLLAPLVAGLQVHKPPVEWDQPGIVATDVAEALVQGGMPFRTAYRTVAHAFAEVEKGQSFVAALEAQGLSQAQLTAAAACLVPNPGRRATLGGPAPSRVGESMRAWRASAAQMATQLAKAREAVGIPRALLQRSVSDILEEPL